MFKLHDMVTLRVDLTMYNLKKGDKGAIVDIPTNKTIKCCLIEFPVENEKPLIIYCNNDMLEKSIESDLIAL
jgi:hypothetical protein